ncbi:MAG: helix-turn-helix domain-containing protein [Ktedonobacteraceae bacterium]
MVCSPLPVHNDKTSNILLLRQRRARGWTQRDVAEKIGTYPVNISRWERGETIQVRIFNKSFVNFSDANMRI